MTKPAGYPGPLMRDPSNLPKSRVQSEQETSGTDSSLETEQDRYAPTKSELRGGASLQFSLWLIVLSAIGIFASQALYRDELAYRPGIGMDLSCDLNAVVKCSSSIGSWQAHLFFGIPNALLGLIAFAGLMLCGILLAFRVRFFPWIWWGFTLLTTAAMGLVIWFMNESINFFGTLCPYCMLTWVVTLALFITFWARQIRVTKPLYLRLRSLVVARWGIGIVVFLAGALWVVIGLWSEIVKLF